MTRGHLNLHTNSTTLTDVTIERQGRRAVRRYVTEQQRTFFPMLPFAFLGTVDGAGQPWASMLVGTPGFIGVPDPQHLRVAARPLFGDPVNETLQEGAGISLLGVQLPTRRRNRVNGVVTGLGRDEAGVTGFGIEVRQVIGICPQYIQAREATAIGDPMAPQPRPVHRDDRLDARARAIVAGSDTFFVASADPRTEDGIAAGPDVSHRGGRAGFVRIDDDRTLTAPDFVGNFLFNTLGNFQFDDRAGLLFVDFSSGGTLYVAARAEVVWDGPEVAAFVGAQRLIRYRVTEVVRVEGALPLSFSAPEDSPLLARTGTWDDAARTLDAEALRTTWRPFRVVSTVDESVDVRSFTLEAADGMGLAAHRAGQFLPVRVPGLEPGGVVRTYTLSDAPGRAYRISVKREGRGGTSDWLHDEATSGTLLEAMAPRGSFVFDTPPDRAVVMLSAGIGITPTMAMLNSLLVNDGRTRHHAPIHVVHGARNGRHHAFAGALRQMEARHGNLKVHVCYSQPEDGDAPDGLGWVDVARLKAVLPFDDYDFYLCGPPGFMQALYDGLRALNVPDGAIHLESFGPASVRRRPGTQAGDDNEESVIVTFSESGKTARWRPQSGSLLDLAEAAGVPALSGCRAGVCGTCAAPVVAGRVDYVEPPVHEIDPGMALLCVGRPHAGLHLEGSDDREGVTIAL